MKHKNKNHTHTLVGILSITALAVAMFPVLIIAVILALIGLADDRRRK